MSITLIVYIWYIIRAVAIWLIHTYMIVWDENNDMAALSKKVVCSCYICDTVTGHSLIAIYFRN